jgi:hypothetical protein
MVKEGETEQPCIAQEKGKIIHHFSWETWRKFNFKHLGINRRLSIKLVLNKFSVRVRSDFIRLETPWRRVLLITTINFWFHEGQEFFLRVTPLSAFQEGILLHGTGLSKAPLARLECLYVCLCEPIFSSCHRSLNFSQNKTLKVENGCEVPEFIIHHIITCDTKRVFT